MMTKIRSAHFIFDKHIRYKDLAEIYPDLFKTFLEETQQMPEDPDLLEIWLQRDMNALNANKKPEGYLKQNAVKMVFPIRNDHVEFYIYNTSRNQIIPVVAEKLEKLLKKRGFKYTLKTDIMLRYSSSK